MRREVPARLERIVMQALEKKPQKRPRDMHEFVEELQRVGTLAVDEPSASTMSETMFLSNEASTKRHKLSIPFVGSVGASVFALVVAYLWFTGVFERRDPAVRVVYLALEGQRELTVGDKGMVKVTGSFTDGSRAPITQDLEWRSSNTTVAIVSGQGEMEARHEGVAEIIARHQGMSSTALTVLVKAKAPPPGPTIDDYVRTARTSRDTGDYDGAFDSLQKAKAIDPKSKLLQAEYQQTKSACLAEKRSGLTNSRCDG
jgi:hypothetical protein